METVAHRLLPKASTPKSSNKNLASWQYYAQNLRMHVAARVPSLKNPNLREKRKGFDGTIGIVGGSKEYTGAPYFAGISALKTGADLVHVFTHPDASSVIKGYCPELVVHPLLSASHQDEVEDSALKISKFFSRLDVLVIGPGLGRDELQLSLTARIIELAKKESIPMVLDADALYLIEKSPSLVQNYGKLILTPNAKEFQRLLDAKNVPNNSNAANLLAQAFGGSSGPSILIKGLPDIIVKDDNVVECKTVGSSRRIGGQGDILAGCLGTLLCWLSSSKSQELDASLEKPLDPYLVASFAACDLVKTAASKAFSKERRAMLTSTVIDHLGASFEELFDPPTGNT